MDGWQLETRERHPAPLCSLYRKRKDGDWGTIIDSCLFVHVGTLCGLRSGGESFWWGDIVGCWFIDPCTHPPHSTSSSSSSSALIGFPSFLFAQLIWFWFFPPRSVVVVCLDNWCFRLFFFSFLLFVLLYINNSVKNKAGTTKPKGEHRYTRTDMDPLLATVSLCVWLVKKRGGEKRQG